MIIRLSTFLLLAGFATAVVAAPVYRWTDSAGNVHFGDQPPPAGAEELAVPQSAAPPAPAPDEATRREQQKRLLDAFEAERKERKAKAAAAREEADQQERACAEARDQLRQYRDAGYLYRLDAKGERVPLTSAERAAAEGELEAAIRENCD